MTKQENIKKRMFLLFMTLLFLMMIIPIAISETNYAIFDNHNNLVVQNPENVNDGGDLKLKFYVDMVVSDASVSIDGKAFQNVNSFSMIEAGITRYEDIPLEGDLLHGVVSNGNHNIKINVTNSTGGGVIITHLFNVNDNVNPVLSLNPNINGETIINSSNLLNLKIISNEYGTVSYKFNDDAFTSPLNLGSTKEKVISLQMKEGANSIIIRLDDLQGNFITETKSFIYQKFTENDLFLNIGLDKSSYNIGEKAKITVDATNGATINMLIIRPDGTTQAIQYVKETYPKEYPNVNLNDAGNYSIIAELTYGAYTKGAVKTFSVNNNIEIYFELNDVYEKNQVIPFNMSSTGGIGDIKYSWDFGDGNYQEGNEIKHIYITEASFVVTAKATDIYGNVKEKQKTILIQTKKRLGVNVKDARTNENMRDVLVSIRDDRVVTDINGNAEFWLFNDTYIVTAFKEGFKTHASELKFTDESQYNIELVTGVTPNITIISPADGAYIDGDSFEIKYFVEHDKPISKCELLVGYSADNDSLELVTEDRDIGNKHLFTDSFYVNKEEDVAGIYYQVRCLDSYLIAGESLIHSVIYNGDGMPQDIPVEEEVIPAEIQDEPETANYNDLLESDDLDISSRLLEVEYIINYLNSKNKEETEAIKVLGIMDSLDAARIKLKNYDRDLYNIKFKKKDEAERLADIEKLKNDILDIDVNMIVDVRVIDSNEFVKYPLPDMISSVLDIYANSTERYKKKRDLDKLKDFHIDYQSKVVVNTDAKIVQIEYKYQGNKTITIIDKDIRLSDDILTAFILEYIPKELAENTKLITFNTPNSIINSDPLIKFDVSSGRRVLYIINKSVDMNLIDQAVSILFDENFKTQSNNMITGLHSSSFENITENLDMKKFFLVILIIAMCIVLVSYKFDDFKEFIPVDMNNECVEMYAEIIKEKVKGIVPEPIIAKIKKEHPEISKMKRLILDSRNYANNNKLMEASLIYDDLKSMYAALAKELKGKIHDDVSRLYMDITFAKIRRLIHKIELYVEDGNSKKAKEIYEEIRLIYYHLPKEYKHKVSEICHEAHRKIKISGNN